jgi:hypothetical protein
LLIPIRELIESLERIEKESNPAKHGAPVCGVTLEFEDEDLDARFFSAELASVKTSYRLGCMCVDGADLVIRIKEL